MDGQHETTGADTGFTTNLGVPSPGSPAAEMGTDVPPTPGGVGAGDPQAGNALSGDDQLHDRDLVDEGSPPTAGALKDRMIGDVDPANSNISGPTPSEEQRGR
jgi:hypothetical protein